MNSDMVDIELGDHPEPRQKNVDSILSGVVKDWTAIRSVWTWWGGGLCCARGVLVVVVYQECRDAEKSEIGTSI